MRTTIKLIIKSLSPLLLLMAFNNAHASDTYPIHLKKNLNGTKVLAEANKVNAPGSMVILKLNNFDKREVKCKASFDPRIEQVKSFTRQLEPNTSLSIRYTTSRTPNQLNIKLVCKPTGDQPVTDSEVPAATEKEMSNKDTFTISKP